jgi:hypothetical protein
MALYTLQFPSYEVARAAAQSLGFWDDAADRLRTDGQGQNGDGSWFGWGIDEVGVCIDTPAEVDPETGEVVTPATFRSGYWVNVNGQLPGGADLAPFLRPYGSAGRVFAGTAPEPLDPPEE